MSTPKPSRYQSPSLASLSRPQHDHLLLLSFEDQPTFGKARVRVQNNLVRKQLAEYINDGDACRITPTGTLALRSADRFWSKVDVRTDDECWRWTASTTIGRRQPTARNLPYGHFSVGGRPKRTLLAHRIAFEITNGPTPEGLVVRHKCDNTLCCNPAHLEIGTHADNTHDAIVRGRHRFPSRRRAA